MRDQSGLRSVIVSGVLILQGAAWVASVLAPNDYRLAIWSALLLIDFATPYFFTRNGPQALPHPEHMPERFGLFTIILLGEAVASALHGLTHAEQITVHALIVSISGGSLSFFFWVGYFHRAKSAAARKAKQVWTARTVRQWVYAHMPFYLGIAGFSAGVVAIASHAHVGGGTAWLQAGAVAATMIGLTLVGLASPNNLFNVGLVWPHLLLAAMTIPAALLAEAVGAAFFMMTLVALTGMQLGIALWTARRASSLLKAS